MNSYPIFLQIKHFRCLVIGGGRVASSKVKGLLAAGAAPVIIAPEIIDTLKILIVENNLEWIQRVYQPGDISGFQLIIAATNKVDVNRDIQLEAAKANLLINDVSDAKNSNFHVPATVRRSPLEIAIGTGGEVPYLSHRLREYFEQSLDLEIGKEIAEMQKCRTTIIERAANDALLKEELLKREMDPLVERFINKFRNI